MASERKMKTKDKREDRKIVRERLMPWNQAGYKAQLQKDLKDIRQKLSRVLGQDLTKSDNSIVEATSPVKCIEGGVLVDLCMQRSGKRGSGCDAPKSADRFPRSADGSFEASKGFPTPVTSPLRPPKPSRTEVRQYSWRNSTRKEVCMHIRTLKPFKSRMEKEELKCKRPGLTNCPYLSDVMVSGVIIASPDSDVTIRDIVDVNRPVARKHYAPRKHLFVHIKEFLKSTLSMCSRTFTFTALVLAIEISVVGGLFNIRLPERKSTIATSSEPLIRFCASSVLSILRESAAVISCIREGICSYMHKRMSLHNNKQLIRHMKVLQNTIICDETFCTQNLVSSSELAKPLITTRSLDYSILSYVTLTQNVLAAKRFDTYIFPSADFCAFRVYYLDTYTVNLELDDNFKVFFDLVYLYIFTFYHSWSSCHWATYASDIFYTLVYFSLNWIVL